MEILSIEHLRVRFQLNEGFVYAVNDVSFKIKKAQRLALVGESGSGKSQLAFSILGLLAKNGAVEGAIKFHGQDLLTFSKKELNKIRMARIAMIFQDPMSSLNPYMRIGEQLSEILIHHEGLSKRNADKRSLDALDAVRIPDAKSRMQSYPHELSGGMRQRIVIAMAILCRPELIIADEPTTALDVTIQAQIMDLLSEIQKEYKAAILLITHDLGVVGGFCDEAIVLYGGRIMEHTRVSDLFHAPTHPYTRGLLSALPSLHSPGERLRTIPGSPPDMTRQLTCCPFSARCPDVGPRCLKEIPVLQGTFPDRACFKAVEELT